MDDISIPAALAAEPPSGQAPDRVWTLWNAVQRRIEDRNEVTSHATEGDSYSRDLAHAERLLLQDYEAYLIALRRTQLADGENEMLARGSMGRGFNFDGVALHQL